MAMPRTVAEVLNDHVTFSLEGIDRMYLNLYVPRLQCEKGVAHFWRFHRGHRFASSKIEEGVVVIGKAQEKVPVFRTERRRAPNGATYPWIVRSHTRVFRSGCARIYPAAWAGGTRLRRAFDTTLNGIDDFVADTKLTS